MKHAAVSVGILRQILRLRFSSTDFRTSVGEIRDVEYKEKTFRFSQNSGVRSRL